MFHMPSTQFQLMRTEKNSNVFRGIEVKQPVQYVTKATTSFLSRFGFPEIMPTLAVDTKKTNRVYRTERCVGCLSLRLCFQVRSRLIRVSLLLIRCLTVDVMMRLKPGLDS